jgi:hypothetical protein
MKNTNYLTNVKEVFQYFHGCNVGEGLFLFRTIDSKMRNYDGQFRNLFYLTVYNLLALDYLSVEDNCFFKLTEKGFAYTQDGEIEQNTVELDAIMTLYKNSYNTLWLIIGNESTALFYLSGPEYYKVAQSYILNLPRTYTEYISLLKERRENTSRSIWYKQLFEQIKAEDRSQFYASLADAIKRVWGEESECSELSSTVPEPIIDNLYLHESEPIHAPVVPTNSDKSLTVFISYSYDSSEHQKWVYKLATDLRTSGLNVRIDVEIPLGADLTKFMEDCVASSDRVLLILTKEYKAKADNRSNGVGYESGLITSELVNDASLVKFVPIMRENPKEQCYPRYLGNRKGLDMTDDACYEKNLHVLISDINNNTKNQRSK